MQEVRCGLKSPGDTHRCRRLDGRGGVTRKGESKCGGYKISPIILVITFGTDAAMALGNIEVRRRTSTKVRSVRSYDGVGSIGEATSIWNGGGMREALHIGLKKVTTLTSARQG